MVCNMEEKDPTLSFESLEFSLMCLPAKTLRMWSQHHATALGQREEKLCLPFLKHKDTSCHVFITEES